METMKESLQAVYQELLEMGDGEFNQLLEKHMDGDIAIALIESGAISESNFVWDGGFIVTSEANSIVLSDSATDSCTAGSNDSEVTFSKEPITSDDYSYDLAA